MLRTWRVGLRIAAVTNLALWCLVAVLGCRGPQLWLAAVFTAVCAFRSFFPVVYIKRFCFDRRWTSSAAVARLIATVAELCFAAQLWLLMQGWARASGLAWVGSAGWLVAAALTAAQGSCWYGVATRRYLGELVEESLWTVGMSVLLAAAVAVGMRHGFDVSVMLGLGLSGTFVGFVVTHNLPMYVRRIRELQVDTLSFADGLFDMHRSRTVSLAWSDWAGEAAWQTPYFTLGVWFSLALALLSGCG